MEAERIQTEVTEASAAPAALPADAQPLVDANGVPLLPRVAARIRAAQAAGEALPPLQAGRVRSVLDAGERYQAIDPSLWADYQQRGRELHDAVTGAVLAEFFGGIVAAVKRGLARVFTPAPSVLEVQRALSPGYRGVLGINASYWRERERYYGRGL